MKIHTTDSILSDGINSAHTFIEHNDQMESGQSFTGKYKCKARPFYQRMFTDGSFIEDKDDLFRL